MFKDLKSALTQKRTNGPEEMVEFLLAERDSITKDQLKRFESDQAKGGVRFPA